MLNAIIRFALNNRLLIVCGSLVAIIYGSITLSQLTIDVFPNLTRPRVVVMTEAHGLAPEEVEVLVTFPLETSLNGASGVQAVRSASSIGLSVIYVEFGWEMDIYNARQIVQERLAVAKERLPEGTEPFMAPISSIMGQIMNIGMWSENGETDSLELRTLADWVVRQRLLSIPGVSQVITMGGGRKQYQVLVNPESLLAYGVSLHEVEEALAESNLNVTGGYLNRGSQEYLVRGLGRLQTLEDIQNVVVRETEDRSILVREVAHVIEGPQIKRGDSSVNGVYPAVVLTIQKQPEADTRQLTEAIENAITELQTSLPKDVKLDPTIYQQREFIDLGIDNVVEALRDGALLVLVILFLFLLNFRTTFITLTAIPLSIVVTGFVFKIFDLSINVMTLGGIAIAMGELVDDAIVDVENIYRRLQLNSASPNPQPALKVIYHASLEIRSAIVFGTMVVTLVFLPLFALSGMEGRLFTPLGIAYIVSILASLVISLTVTPVLSSYLLRFKATEDKEHADGFVLRGLKAVARPMVQLSTTAGGMSTALATVVVAVGISVIVVNRLGSDFLPPFDEGAAQVNIYLPPGASLETSNRVAGIVDDRFQELMASDENPDNPIKSFVRRSGRAELDEHAMEVNITEYILSLNHDSPLSREETLAMLREELEEIPGIQFEAEQPLAHLISHMLSGVTAQIAIKLYGDDLSILRGKAQEIKAAIESVPNIAPPVVEQQQILPQLRIELQRDKLAFYGLSAAYVNEFVEAALNGTVVSSVLEGQRTFDLLIRLDEPYRKDYANLHRLTLSLPDGGRIPLSAVASVYEGGGPNTINRENARRRITVRVNTTGGNVGGAVEQIQKRIRSQVDLPEGYFIEYAGQFEAQQEASRLIIVLSIVSLAGVFLVLYTLFPSVRLVLQILIALPAAFIGGVAALAVTGQTLTVASMVGFISLGGIATRNGILLVSHYLHLMREEGESFSQAMIVRGSLERLAPVLMTALTTGIGLVPLVIGGEQPGKEILYPVATVILGGLITSTLCEFLVRPGLFWWFSGPVTSLHKTTLEAE